METKMLPTLSLSLDQPLESGAAVLAAIAWPDALPDGEPVAAAQAGLIAHVLRSAAASDPGWAWSPQLVKPSYLLIPANKVARSVRVASKRLGEALAAARIARPFVTKVLLGAPPPLPMGVPRLSLNSVIPFTLGDASRVDPHNHEHRVFRRALPVLHLAIALEQAIGAAEEATGRQPDLGQVLVGEGFLEWIVARAEALEPAVLAITEFTVPPDRLLQVRFRG